MKRLLSLILLLSILATLSACAAKTPAVGGSDAAGQAESTAVPAVEETMLPEETVEPIPVPSQEPENLDWASMYREFLRENYDKLSQLCYGGIAGIAFIDLDLDNTAELILFDSGASASMGIQFFDIIDGKVECVSANILEIGDAYGGDHYSTAYVNANFISDFKLYDRDGQKFFEINSSNGALDFVYNEQIFFSRATDGSNALCVTSGLYKREAYDIDTSETTNLQFAEMGIEITEQEYNAGIAEFQASCTDTGYEGYGVFVWEMKNYTDNLENFLSMTEQALAGYVPALA